MTAREYDVIVIGAGAVGENVADRTVQGGLSTVIVEAELVGGECSYWACMPSKALLRAGTVLRAARAVEGASAAVTGEIDPPGVLARRDRIVHDWSDDSQVAWLDKAGIDLIRGHGRLTGPRAVQVTAADGTVTELDRDTLEVARGVLELVVVERGAVREREHGLEVEVRGDGLRARGRLVVFVVADEAALAHEVLDALHLGREGHAVLPVLEP